MARTAYTASTLATMQVFTGTGALTGIFVSSVGSSGTMAIYDSVAATTGTAIINTFTLAAGYTDLGNIEPLAGIYIETNGSPIWTALTLSVE